MIDQVLICIFAPLIEVPSAILPAPVARIAKTVSLALLAACLPAVVHGQLSTYAAPASHLTQIHHQAASGQTLARYRYERDAKGRLTQASEQTAGQSETIKTWQYDADGKLTRESTQQAGQSRTCAYQHDRVGNRTEKDCDGHKTSYSYNELDQL